MDGLADGLIDEWMAKLAKQASQHDGDFVE